MTLSPALPQALLATILGRLVRLLLTAANNDETAARQAAIETLADYQPETAAELRLAANIVSFSLHALEALSQAASPDLSLAKPCAFAAAPSVSAANPTKPNAAWNNASKPAEPATRNPKPSSPCRQMPRKPSP
jgi:hypothetical protein